MPGPYPRYSKVCPDALINEGLLTSNGRTLIFLIIEPDAAVVLNVPNSPLITVNGFDVLASLIISELTKMWSPLWKPFAEIKLIVVLSVLNSAEIVVLMPA